MKNPWFDPSEQDYGDARGEGCSSANRYYISFAGINDCRSYSCYFMPQILIGSFFHFFFFFVALLFLWQPTWNSFSRTKSEMGCVSAGTFGHPVGWKLHGWLCPSGASSPHWKNGRTYHPCSMNQSSAPGQHAKRSLIHFGKERLIIRFNNLRSPDNWGSVSLLHIMSK